MAETGKGLLEALNAPRISAAVVTGDPVLAFALARTCAQLRNAMAAVPLAVLFPPEPELASLHARPEHAFWVSADPALFPRRMFGGPKLDAFGDGYRSLGALVGARVARLERALERGAVPSAETAAVAAELADAACFLQRMEQPFQMRDLQLPANEALVKLAAGPWLQAAAAAADSGLAGQAARAIVGLSLDRLCNYSISQAFGMRKGRGLDAGWEVPPPSAQLYGLGWALQHADGDAALSAARVINGLSCAERWLVAEVGLALVGTACQGNGGVGHCDEARDLPLRDGIEAALLRGPPLVCALCAMALWGMLNVSENPSVLGRALCHGSVGCAQREREPFGPRARETRARDRARRACGRRGRARRRGRALPDAAGRPGARAAARGAGRARAVRARRAGRA
jgi:hypothetical protein